MSALTEKVAREHRPRISTASARLSNLCAAGCIGTFFESPSDVREHIAEVTEAAVRAAVAADIRVAGKTRAQVQAGVRGGMSVDYYDGWDGAIHEAARIAEGKQP